MMSSSKDVGSLSGSGPGVGYFRPELKDLKVIGVEEHAEFPSLLARVPDAGVASHSKAVFGALKGNHCEDYIRGRLDQISHQRVKDMDEAGMAMSILSLAGPVNCMHMEDPQASLKLAQDVNNELKKAVDAQPTRYRAFAELPFNAPDLAIQELRRCVEDLGFVGSMLSGSVGGTGKFLDAPEFDALLTEFERLDVPLFLHPGIPPKTVVDTYYDFPANPTLSAMWATTAWGWHNEVAIHVLRLAASGTLERHPKLRIIVGHHGEMLPMMLQRTDWFLDATTFGLRKSVGETLRRQVWIAISGIFTLPPTMLAIQTWGVDRVVFANDYPFIDAQRVPMYLKALNDVVAPADMRKICQTNAEELFRIKA